MGHIDTTNKSAFLYAKSIFPQMIKICEPLKHLGIKHFGYVKVFRDSSYLHLTNGLQEYQEKYFKNLFYIEKHWVNPLQKTAFNSTCVTIWPLNPSINSIAALCYEHNIWNGISIAYKTYTYLETFYFSCSRQSENNPEFFIQNLNTLKAFNEYFKSSSKNLIDCTDKNKLATFKNFYNWLGNTDKLNSENKKKQMFLNDIGKGSLLNLNLSPQEHRCIEYLAQGNTFKEIGRILSISPRTVENYIENIKNKTGLNV